MDNPTGWLDGAGPGASTTAFNEATAEMLISLSANEL